MGMTGSTSRVFRQGFSQATPVRAMSLPVLSQAVIKHIQKGDYINFYFLLQFDLLMNLP